MLAVVVIVIIVVVPLLLLLIIFFFSFFAFNNSTHPRELGVSVRHVHVGVALGLAELVDDLAQREQALVDVPGARIPRST